MLLLTQTLVQDKPPGLVWLVGAFLVSSGYLLLRLRNHLINQDMFFFKVRLSASEDGSEEDDEKEEVKKTSHGLKTKMNNVYMSLTVPFHRDKTI